MSTIRKVNTRLQRAGRPERLVRGAGYYYLTECEDSMLCVYTLDDGDLQLALDHVSLVLSTKDGAPFTLTP